jgi:hypothetical protein
MRVLTIFVRYGTEHYLGAEDRLDQIFNRQLPLVDRTTIIVDNALPSSFYEKLSDSRLLMGGSNCAWEFSAWNEALEHMGKTIWTYDLVHLVTSAFDTLYTKYLGRFDQQMLELVAKHPVCVGHIDCYNEPVRIRAFQSQHWIRTSFLFIPPTEIKLLGSLVSFSEQGADFGDGPEQPFRDETFISKNYQNYVLDWLTGAEIGQGTVWHSKIQLNAQSWPLFRSKAAAIFNEHLLAIRLRAQGTKLIDTTWLATELATKAPGMVDWNRSWRDQLNERDSDPVSVGLTSLP